MNVLGPRTLYARAKKILSAIVENIPDMIFVKDAEQLRFVRFNRAGETFLGYSREELPGKNDHDLFSKEQADFFNRIDRKVLSEGALHEVPAEMIRTRDKGSRILNTKKIVLFNEYGRPGHLLGISEDITEKIESARELEQ